MDTRRVETGSRLHFGPLSWKGDGPQFGGIGLMIEEPRNVVTAKPAERFAVSGSAAAEQKLADVVRHFEAVDVAPHEFHTLESAPLHHGFGAGTQLACAAAAACRSSSEVELAADELAQLSGRGKRSAIGIHGFLKGGFLVDAGRQRGSLGVLATRNDFPDAWVVLLDIGDAPEVAGTTETTAFGELAPMPSDLTGRLCNLTLRSIVPAVIASEFATFAEALTEYGRLVGQFFAAQQGGVFADPFWREHCDVVRANFRAAVAQSSWGPSVAVILESDKDAERLQQNYPERQWLSTKARNGAASITGCHD